MGLVSSGENNNFKNKVKSIISKTKISYYRKLFQRNHGNMKKTWDLIKSLTVSNIASDLPCMGWTSY